MFEKVQIDLTVQYAKRKITFGFARLPLTKQFLQQFHCKIVYMASPKLIRLEFEVYGKVQGNVLFSYFFRENAWGLLKVNKYWCCDLTQKIIKFFLLFTGVFFRKVSF